MSLAVSASMAVRNISPIVTCLRGGERGAFNLYLVGAPRQATLRFGGFGPIVNGDGMFTDIEGLLMHDSAVGITPLPFAFDRMHSSPLRPGRRMPCDQQ